MTYHVGPILLPIAAGWEKSPSASASDLEDPTSASQNLNWPQNEWLLFIIRSLY